jgi:biopolymer transport protein ExbD
MAYSAAELKRRRHARSQLMTDINVAPFVDVMLVLVVILMVAAPLLKFGMEVNVPEAALDPIPESLEPLVINVDGDGVVHFGDTPIAADLVITRLSAMAVENDQLQIFLRADRLVAYEKVMDVVEMIKQSGFTKVALITDSPSRLAQ